MGTKLACTLCGNALQVLALLAMAADGATERTLSCIVAEKKSVKILPPTNCLYFCSGARKL